LQRQGAAQVQASALPPQPQSVAWQRQRVSVSFCFVI